MPDVYLYGFAYKPPKPTVLNERFLVQPKPVLDPKTGETKIDESDKLDLVELIQSYKDQCGVEFMLKQVKIGAIAPESLADDGNHSGDASMPLDVNDAYRANLASKVDGAKLADALGLKEDELTEENIRKAIEAIYAKTAKAEEVKKDE